MKYKPPVLMGEMWGKTIKQRMNESPERSREIELDSLNAKFLTGNYRPEDLERYKKLKNLEVTNRDDKVVK